MGFTVGETVVYPHHGAALIEAIEKRTVKGEEKAYLVLKVAQGDLTVRVPADNAEIVGVRDVVGQEGLNRVFEVLRAPHTEEPTNWSRRYKANLEKLASGDVNKVAEVVRDLWRRDKDRGLSAGEKRMLSKARQILVSELALAAGAPAGVPVLPVVDTTVTGDDDGVVGEALPRASLRRVQTPQGFARAVLADAYARLPAAAELTDDAAVVRAAGVPVATVQ